MFKWLIGGILILFPFCSAFAQAEIRIDSGYTYREVVPEVCDAPDHMCHYFKFVAFNDIQVLEFTMRRLNGGIVQGFMNFRVLFPNGFNRKDTTKKWPGIVMLHGAGEAGRSWQGNFEYFPTDIQYDNNGKNINHGGEAHINAVNRNPALPNSFPGFVIWPQNHHSGAWEGGWNGGVMSQDMTDVATFVEYFIANYNLNPDRIALHGLSNGAKGVWDLASKRNDLFAAILPFSGVPRDYEQQSNVLVTTPVWLFQGGLDGNPTPGSARQIIDLLIEKGGNPRYSLYSDLGHGTWNRAIAEPDFFPFIKAQDKRKIYVFGGESVICEGGTLRLGFSANYLAYQWTYNGVDIPGATDRYYNATQLGTYTVKFLRRTNNKWAESYPQVVSLKAESTFSPLITNSGSTTLPIGTGTSLIGGIANNVILTAPLGYSQYFWLKDGNVVADTQVNTRLVSANNGQAGDEGTYTAQVLEASGCLSRPSNPIVVTYQSPQPTTLIPRPALATVSPTEVNLTWTDVANETAYEVWQFRRSLAPYPAGQNWRLVTILPANTTSYVCRGLRPMGQYQFRLRAISSPDGTFSQVAPTSGFHVMPDETIPPTAPTDLIVTSVNESSVTIAWSPAADNDVIHRYRVYNGQSFVDIFSDATGDQTDGNPAPPLTHTFTNLSPSTTFFLNVRAIDFRGNISPFADGVVATTTGVVTGVAYSYYEFTGTIPPGSPIDQELTLFFNNNPVPVETGIVSGFNISPRNREDQFVFAFEGYIQINTTGTHRFYTRSDDGSRLYIKSSPAAAWTSVVANDGPQGPTTVSNTFSFPTTGKYPIRVTFFEQGGGQELTVKYNAGTNNNYDNATNLTNANSVLFLNGTTVTNYYSKSNGDLSLPATWGTSTNGSGNAPANFTADNQHFFIQNRTTVNHTTSWTVSGSGSRVVATNGVTLNLTAPIIGTIEASGNAVINVNNATTPSFGLLSSTSTVNFNVAGTVPPGSYGNLNLNSASTTKTLPAGSVFVKGQLAAQDGVTILGADQNISVVNVAGNITLNGTSGATPPANAKYSLAFFGGTNHTVNLTGPGLEVFSLSAGVADVININNGSATPPNITLTGGNLILKDRSILNVGAGTLSVSGVAAINPNAESGAISINGGNFIFQSTASQNSSVYFHETLNTVHDFTYSAPNTVNLVIGSPVKVRNILTLPQGGRLNANGNLTLLSTASLSARVAPIGGGARIVGDVNFQRYMQGEGTIYRYLSVPVKQTTVADLQQYIPITGLFTGRSPISGSSSASMFQYDLPNTLDGGWKAFPTTTNLDSLRRGKGYAVYVREGVNPTTWQITGEPFQGDIPFHLTPSNPANSNEGWNLIGNPYPCPIQWTGGTSAGKWNAQGIGNTIYVRENSGTTSIWRSWNGSVGNLTNGIIAPGQAFWVQTAATNPLLVISEGAKVITDGSFYRTAAQYTNALEIILTNGAQADYTYIQTTASGSDAYVKTEDAVKHPNSFFNLSSNSSDGVDLAINIVAEAFCEKSVSLNVDNAVAGTYSIKFSGFPTFYHGLVATLIDHYLGTSQPLTEGSVYEFTITTDPLSKGSRFELVMAKPEIQKDLVISSPPVCEGDITITIDGAQQGVQYQAFNGDVMVSDKGEDDGTGLVNLLVSRTALPGGVNELVVKAGFNGCQSLAMDHTLTTSVDSLVQPEIYFSENDKLIASTPGADTYKWFFNGEIIAGEDERELLPSHVGDYVVEVSVGACTKASEVFNYLPTGLENDPEIQVSIYPNPFDDRITVQLNGIGPRRILIQDLLGKILYDVNVNAADREVSIDASFLIQGIYLLRVGQAQHKIVKKN